MKTSNVIGSRIKEIRKQRKLTQVELSKLTGFKQNTISGHENGTRTIDENDIRLYADALNVKPSELFENETYEEIDTKKVPVVSKISAGIPLYSEQNILEYAYIPSYLSKSGKELFYLRVQGDSMDKEFKEGDLVLIEKDSIVENGQIGVVMVNGYNATVKRVKYSEDKIILLPESNNSDHLPQIYTNKDKVKMIGKVISVQKFY